MLPPTLSVLTFSLLGLAQVLPWIYYNRSLILGLTIAGLVCAVGAGHLAGMGFGLPLFLLLAALLWVFYLPQIREVYRFFLWIGIILIGLIAFFHVVPGVSNLLLIDGWKISAASASAHLWMNIDKILVSLLILLLAPWYPVPTLSWRGIVQTSLKLTALLVVLLGVLALASGFVTWDPKVPSWAPFWMLFHLVFVVVTEEIFFRFFIQGYLEKQCTMWRISWLWALVGASLLFVLPHLCRGLPYAAMSFVASLVYGYAFYRTGRVEASILVHFGLNLVHFLFFTYPHRMF